MWAGLILAQNDDGPLKRANGPYPIQIHSNFQILMGHLKFLWALCKIWWAQESLISTLEQNWHEIWIAYIWGPAKNKVHFSKTLIQGEILWSSDVLCLLVNQQYLNHWMEFHQTSQERFVGAPFSKIQTSPGGPFNIKIVTIIPHWVTYILILLKKKKTGRIAQSVTCLTTDASLTADPGVASSIPARSHTFVEIDHEIISTVILLPSAESFKKGCCQLQAKICARSTGLLLVQACPGKSVVRWTDRPAMTIAVDLGRKATKQTNLYPWLAKIAYNKYQPSI